LLALIRALPAVEVQNRLMGSANRELAMGLALLSLEERREVLSRLSPKKQRAVEEELALQRRLHIEPEQRRRMTENLIARIRGERRSTAQSYLRPRTRRGE